MKSKKQKQEDLKQIEGKRRYFIYLIVIGMYILISVNLFYFNWKYYEFWNTPNPILDTIGAIGLVVAIFLTFAFSIEDDSKRFKGRNKDLREEIKMKSIETKIPKMQIFVDCPTCQAKRTFYHIGHRRNHGTEEVTQQYHCYVCNGNYRIKDEVAFE